MFRSRVWFAILALVPLAHASVVSGYHLDARNTQVSFSISRFGLHWVTARFGDLSGEFVLDPGAGSTLTVAVRMDSIDCHDAYWNDRLRSVEWLDTKHFPEMAYKSTRIELGRPGQARVFGDLTLHGISRPVTLNITDIDCAGANPSSCRFSGHAQLRRSEFNLPHGFWQGGDAVEILLRGS